ncbi:MAG TPA: phosphoglycerate kinase [Dongiaceae bacterium]|jgi:phosphoglycerate kinase|nr:phosphoglycerate kinase [Dongiaceae bacterium]
MKISDKFSTFSFQGKRALVRADLNVPIQDGKVTDMTRIDRLAPTVTALRERGAAVILMSHFGRPKGREEKYSLRPLVATLAQAFGAPVAWAEDCVGPIAEQAVHALRPGQVLLLENLRFHPEEEANDPAFAQQLARLGDVYVNDAFSCSHRAHASTEAIAHLLPKLPGLGMEAELFHLSRVLDQPRRPVLALIGGAKISTKLALIGNLLAKVDRLAIGGGMANTFLAAQGIAIGASLAERDMLDVARTILAQARERDCAILLPKDAIVAREFRAGAPSRQVAIDEVLPDDMILDIGPASIADLIATLDDTRSVVWNGPLGAFEISPFDAGTKAIAAEIARRSRDSELVSVAGGGDTVAALGAYGKDFTYLSTAGGAFLEWLEGKVLPGVAALAD